MDQGERRILENHPAHGERTLRDRNTVSEKSDGNTDMTILFIFNHYLLYIYHIGCCSTRQDKMLTVVKTAVL